MQSSAELDKMAKRLESLERRESDRESTTKRDEMERLERARLAGAPSVGGIVAPPEAPAGMRPGAGLFSQVGTATPVGPPTRPPKVPDQALSGAGGEDIPTGPRIRSVSIDDAAAKSTAPGTTAVAGDLVNSSRRFGEEEARRRGERVGASGGEGSDPGAEDEASGGHRAVGRSVETYLPAGTFVRASLLNGLDAPTGGQAQQNPHPILLRLEDNAQLPNSVRANLKGCFVTGNGHGDLSAERAYIRLDRLTCVDDEGGAIDVSVRGYVSGEDGKTGMRGRLVTKSGQVLANALFVGVLGGFGEALRQGAVSTTTATATGAQTQTISNALEYGVGTGVGKAMDRLSQYYVKLADKLFPVVEIDGGRVVDVVLTRGISIERK